MNENVNQNKPKIVLTGGSGLVGSRIIELLQQTYQFINISREKPSSQISKTVCLDINDEQKVRDFLLIQKPQVILHLAAIASVEACEANKKLAYNINVKATKNMVKTAAAFDCRFIFVSTGFVFKGDKELYVEDDLPEPQNYYAQTKYEAEQIVKTNCPNWNIIRFNYPYRAIFPKKSDCIRWMIPKLRNGEEITVVKDQYVKPVFIDAISEMIYKIVSTNENGIFHAADNTCANWVEIAHEVAKVFECDQKLIKGISLDEFLQMTNRMKSPLQVSLNTLQSEKRLKMQMNTLHENLLRMKEEYV